jgi:arylsulfatase A-like enzyme
MIARRLVSRSLRSGFCLLVVIVVVQVAGFASAQTAENRKPAPRRPSILFILADDLGYGDLGCYGQTQIKTPNIDQLAAEGMRFTDFYAGCTVCAPSRAALMTGKHTGHARIRGNGNISLQTADTTIAEILHKEGFRTAAIGKWGLGNRGTPGVPGKKGFDQWFGYLDQVAAHDYYPTALDRTGDGHDGMMEVSENFAGKKGRYSNEYFTFAGSNFCRINVPDRFNHYRPFFLYLAYTLPHANNELGQKTGNGMEVPGDAPYSNEPWPQVEKNKAAMITLLDAYVGELMAVLKKYKEDENTIIIFTSDNGPHNEGGVNSKYFKSGGPLRGIKRDLYEGGIRVPLIVWWPGRVKAGTTSSLPSAFWDFMATFAELYDFTPPKDTDGISFLPTLLGQTQTNRHEFLYWEFHEGGFKQAVRAGDWKAVRFGEDGPLELYNLKTDLGEKTDVADKNPDIVSKIEAYLKTARTVDTNWPAKSAAESPKKQYGS